MHHPRSGYAAAQSVALASEDGLDAGGSANAAKLDRSYRITDKSDASKHLAYGVAVLSFVLLLIFSVVAYSTGSSGINAATQLSSSAAFDSLNRYIMPNFDEAKPMSDFLCGIGTNWHLL